MICFIGSNLFIHMLNPEALMQVKPWLCRSRSWKEKPIQTHRGALDGVRESEDRGHQSFVGSAAAAPAMGRSRRAFRKSNPTVRVGLPKRKSAKAVVPDTIVLPGTGTKLEWDGKASLISNYKSMGLVANPNVVGARSGTKHLVQVVSLQKPLSADGEEQYGSDDEPDDVKSVLHKKRLDGKKAPLQKLTTMQRVYVSRLILKHGDDYVAMSKDLKLNRMQHAPGAIKHLCERFHKYEKLSDYSAST